MSYYILYNPALGNALVGLVEVVPDPLPEGILAKVRQGELPDLTHKIYNPSVLDFYDNPSVALTKREFIKRLTATEYAAIKSAAAANAELDYYWQMFMLAKSVSLTDPDTIAGVQMLEGIGLLAAGRAAEILA